MQRNSEKNRLVQRIIGTGGLTGSLGRSQEERHNSIDVVVAAGWFKPYNSGLTKEDINCIEDYFIKHGMSTISCYRTNIMQQVLHG